MRNFPLWRMGMPVDLDEMARIDRLAQRTDKISADGLDLEMGDGGIAVADTRRLRIRARLTASNSDSTYSWEHVQYRSGSWQTLDTAVTGTYAGGGAGLAREVNGNTSVPVNKIVWLDLADDGESWEFAYEPGSTSTTTSSLVVPAINSTVTVDVQNVSLYPRYSYVIVTDGTTAFLSQVTNVSGNTLTLLNLAMLVGIVGATITVGAIVPAGPAYRADETSLSLASYVFSRTALSGDVTASAGSSSTLIPDGTVTNAKSANMASWSLKLRNAGSAGVASNAQLGDLTSATPASGDYLLGFLSSGALRRFDVGDLPSGSGASPYPHIDAASLTANVTSWDPDEAGTMWDDANQTVIRVQGDADGRTVRTMASAVAEGERFAILNVHASYTIVIEHNAGVGGTNFYLPGDRNLVIGPSEMQWFIGSVDGGGSHRAEDRGTEATKTEMQAGTSTSSLVTVRRVNDHDGIAKGICVYTPGTNTVELDVNVTSVTENGTGDFTVTWDTDFTNATYAVAVTWVDDTDAVVRFRISAKAAGTVRVLFYDTTDTLTDPDEFSVIAYGRQ